MKKDTALELQSRIFAEVFQFNEIAGAHSANFPEAPVFVPSAQEMSAQQSIFKSHDPGATSGLSEKLRVGIGVHPPGPDGSDDDHAIILLCQEEQDLKGEIVSRARDIAQGDVIALHTGPVIIDINSLSGDDGANSQAAAHLEIGDSTGHVDISAGTIGGFVDIENDGPYILSNNHVLANTNAALMNDPILAPARSDGGVQPTDVVAKLSDFIKLDFGSMAGNDVDAAVARVQQGVSVNRNTIRGGPTGNAAIQFNGDTSIVLAQDHVWKVGRTTDWTDGNVLSLNQSLTARYVINGSSQIIHFAGQITMDGAAGAFSKGGDSGSMVLNDDNEAVGLLFAGTSFGGRNGGGITYVNPMTSVLARLGAAF